MTSSGRATGVHVRESKQRACRQRQAQGTTHTTSQEARAASLAGCLHHGTHSVPHGPHRPPRPGTAPAGREETGKELGRTSEPGRVLLAPGPSTVVSAPHPRVAKG